MKKYLVIATTLSLLFSLTAYSQSVSERLDNLEKQIDKTRRIDTQESLNLLDQIYTICREYPDSTMFYARALLYEAIINSEEGIIDSVLQETIQLQLKRENIKPKEKVLLESALTYIYYTLGDLSQAFDVALNLLSQARGLNDSSVVVRTLNILGNICKHTELYEMAEEYYLEALDWTSSTDDMYYPIKVNIYTNHSLMGEKDIYMDSLLLLTNKLEDMGMNDMLPGLYTNMSQFTTDKEESFNYLKKAQDLYVNSPHKYALVSSNIGKYYLEKDDKDKALENSKIAQQILEKVNYYDLSNVYRNISSIYRQHGALDSALFYMDKVLKTEKRHENNRKMIGVYKKYISDSLETSENKLALAEAKNQLKDKQLVISAISILAVLIAGILLLTLFVQKRKRMKHEMLLKEAEAIAKSEQLENKLREVTSYSLLLANKNNILSRIRELNNLRVKDEADELEIKKQINKLVKNNLNTNEYWNDFVVHFTEVNPTFLVSLQESFPDITQNELKLCAYIRMGMSTKQIAQMLNISYRSVDMNKYRLKKKLNLSSDESLHNYIMAN